LLSTFSFISIWLFTFSFIRLLDNITLHFSTAYIFFYIYIFDILFAFILLHLFIIFIGFQIIYFITDITYIALYWPLLIYYFHWHKASQEASVSKAEYSSSDISHYTVSACRFRYLLSSFIFNIWLLHYILPLLHYIILSFTPYLFNIVTYFFHIVYICCHYIYIYALFIYYHDFIRLRHCHIYYWYIWYWLIYYYFSLHYFIIYYIIYYYY